MLIKKETIIKGCDNYIRIQRYLTNDEFNNDIDKNYEKSKRFPWCIFKFSRNLTKERLAELYQKDSCYINQFTRAISRAKLLKSLANADVNDVIDVTDSRHLYIIAHHDHDMVEHQKFEDSLEFKLKGI